jgi:DNA excision repair protein ERCC-2
MAVRANDSDRTLVLSVRDLVEEGAPGGHLSLEVVQSRSARAAAGRAVHTTWQSERTTEIDGYRAEVWVERTLTVAAWTIVLQGRADGVHDEGGHTVVEEVKSTALDARRLLATTADDFPGWRDQLEIYLWMLAEEGRPDPTGRLVLVSLVDGSRQVIGVPLDRARVADGVHERLGWIVAARARRIAWLARRRARTVPIPHGTWRPGQREIAEAVQWGLEAGHRILVQAPTGLGKTAAAMVGVITHALATDRQVFWATARTTQQAGVVRTLGLLAQAGLPLRSVVLAAREKACLHTHVACRAEECPFADGYHDKLRDAGLPYALAGRGDHVSLDDLRDAGRAHRVCPFELGLDLTEDVDVVVGDYNDVLDPSVHLRRHFADVAPGWIVVADEVHQLADRAREWFGPRVEAALAREAAARLWLAGPAFAAFAGLAQRIEAAVLDGARGAGEVGADGLAPATIDPDRWTALAEEIDAVAFDYALTKADQPSSWSTDDDPWLPLARQVLRMSMALGEAGEETVPVVSPRPGAERVQLLCLDPSPHLGPRLARLGGFVGLSATLTPPVFHRDLLGLPEDGVDVFQVPSPFPPEHRRILVAPRVSTAWRDRETHAGPIAKLVQECIEAVPGNVAVYCSSFAVLDDLVGRWTLADREILVQRPGMDDALRAEALARLATPGRKVLGAVLGGVFAEGIDLPPGALSAIIVVGPALPPIGLERDLLHAHFERRFGRGFLYGSLVPGLTRVVQAAGRLVRREEDRGVIVLVDRRFRWREVGALLPPEWTVEIAAHPARAIEEFFA